MPEGNSPCPTPPTQRVLLLLSLALLGGSCVAVLRPFLSPIVWAGILAYASWPVYRRLHELLPMFDTAAALLMTLMMTCAVVIPVLCLLYLVQAELSNAYRDLTGYLTHEPKILPSVIRDIPWLGGLLQEQFLRYTSDPTELSRTAISGMQQWATGLVALLGNLGRNFLKIFLTILTLFFFYRDGDAVAHQTRVIVRRVFEDRLDRYAATAGVMTRAVLFGLLASAFAQGAVAGLGYRVVGLENPVLLGVLTGLLSIVPGIGTGLIWLPVSLWVLATGSIWKGLLLVAWCSVLVHPIDNVLRPLLISNATQVPFLLVMFGVIGGLTTFGLVGVFVGPMLLGIAVTVWREWAEQRASSPSCAASLGAQVKAEGPEPVPRSHALRG
jgi:predicted PurR-regulated permease PerM